MPTWTMKFTDITMTSDQVAANANFAYNLDFVGPRRQIRAERQFLEEVMRGYPEFMVTWAVMQQNPAFAFRLRSGGSPIRSGTDGVFAAANDRFRSVSANFTTADIGKVIRIPRPSTPAFAAGHYLIESVPNTGAIEIFGIKPGNATNLNWEIWEAGDAIVALTDLAPV